jgi:hypothetical protein
MSSRSERSSKQGRMPSSDGFDDSVAEPSSVGVSGSCLSDCAQRDDFLGFAPYVEAVATFLAHKLTSGPLTISVEGEWGSGKSSFMLQLEKRLREKEKYTVNFNAWRHDKDDTLWAAFALKFLKDLRKQLSLRERIVAAVKLRALRFEWGLGSIGLLWTALVLGTVVFALAWVFQLLLQPEASEIFTKAKNEEELFWQLLFASGAAGYAVLIVFALIKLKTIFVDPVFTDLRQFVKTPAYNQHTAFLEQFHADFANIVKTYVGEHRIFVFVDDLDRCELPKAADLMQALNLMISDAPPIIFIIGMDREKVAAGLAVKYEKLLPYLASTQLGANYVDPRAGIEFGFSFIEKFVQLPFKIPQPTEQNIDELVRSINYQELANAGDEGFVDEGTNLVTIFDAADSDDIRRLIRMVAPTFEYNPRRIKQFINTFRLKTHISDATGLFADSKREYYPLGLERLAKFTAISLRWPLLLADLDDDPILFDKIYEYLWQTAETSPATKAVSQTNAPAPSLQQPNIAEKWSKVRLLAELLLDGCPSGESDEENRIWSLIKLDVQKLLRTSPIRSSRQQRGRQDQVHEETFYESTESSSEGDYDYRGYETSDAQKVS